MIIISKTWILMSLAKLSACLRLVMEMSSHFPLQTKFDQYWNPELFFKIIFFSTLQLESPLWCSLSFAISLPSCKRATSESIRYSTVDPWATDILFCKKTVPIQSLHSISRFHVLLLSILMSLRLDFAAKYWFLNKVLMIFHLKCYSSQQDHLALFLDMHRKCWMPFLQ